jgi:hypothetical protein
MEFGVHGSGCRPIELTLDCVRPWISMPRL